MMAATGKTGAFVLVPVWLVAGLLWAAYVRAASPEGGQAGPRAGAETLLDDFEGLGAPAPWVFGNGPEFPGATGGLALGEGHVAHGAELRFDFTGGGAYVQASLTLARLLPAKAAAFWVRSPAGILVVLRVTDSTGQVLQYDLERPLWADDSSVWYRHAVDLSAPDIFWGGANDGVLHDGVAAVAILAANPLEPGMTGALSFDEVALLDGLSFKADPFSAGVLAGPAGVALPERLGVNIHFTQDDRALDAARDAGFHFVRMDLAWEAVEPSEGAYDFSAYDALMDALEARGMGALLIFDYGNHLYTGGWQNPPLTADAVSAFARYAGAAAEHFKGRDVRFEVWNEPNIPVFWPDPDPGTYASLARQTAESVLAKAPQAKVTTGGLSTYDFGFLRSELLAGASRGACAVGIHPYLDSPERNADGVLFARSTVSQCLSPALPLWQTEWGYSSSRFGNGHSEEARIRQAVMAVRELLASWAADFPLIVYYDLRDDGTDPANWEHNFGLLDHGYAEKPAMRAVKALTSLSAGRRLAGFLPAVPSDLHALLLDGANDRTMALWLSRQGTEVSVGLPSGSTATDLFGSPLSLEAGDGGLSHVLRESDGPVYVRVPYPPGPVLMQASAEPDRGTAPLTVALAAAASGGAPPYEASWDFGDGSPRAQGMACSHVYNSAGRYEATAAVTDASGLAATASVPVQVESPVDPPSISGVAKASAPFRLVVRGTGFHPSCRIEIGGRAVPQSVWKSPARLLAKGGETLKAMVPKGVAVQVTVVNTDDGGRSAPYSFVW